MSFTCIVSAALDFFFYSKIFHNITYETNISQEHGSLK